MQLDKHFRTKSKFYDKVHYSRIEREVEDIYNEFLDSEEAEQNKSEYECLQEWIENHQGTIDRLIETNFRLMEE